MSSFDLNHHLFKSYFDQTVRSWSWWSRWWLGAARCWPFRCKEKCITFKSTQIQSRLGSGQYCTWLIVLVWIACIAAVLVTVAAGKIRLLPGACRPPRCKSLVLTEQECVSGTTVTMLQCPVLRMFGLRPHFNFTAAPGPGAGRWPVKLWAVFGF